MNTQWLKTNYPSIALVGLMGLTRVHHFGDTFSLPDASLAVFFLAGLAFNRWGLFALLLIEAAAIDYVAIAHFSVNDYCISPAYVFLIPTYAVMWYAGRYCSRFKSLNKTELVVSFCLTTLATTIAFAISNGSFYVFSGRFANLAWQDYAVEVVQYYPSYASAALIYTLIGFAIAKIIMSIPALLEKHKTT